MRKVKVPKTPDVCGYLIKQPSISSSLEFDFKSWYGEVTKEYNDPDYGDEWHQYNSFADWGEDADIFS